MDYFDCRKEIKDLGLSWDRADKIMSIIKKYYTPNDIVESAIEDGVEKRTKELDAQIAKVKKIADNPQILLSEMIGKIVCEHLSLDEKSEMYSGRYVELSWDNKDLGSSCIQSYPED